MSRVLITGGAGFVGSHTARRLMDLGEQVFILDYFHRYVYPIQPTVIENTQYRFDVFLRGAEIVYGTTTLKDDLRRYVSEIKPDFVLHLAGLPMANTALKQSEEAFDSIVRGTVNMLEILRDHASVQKFLYVSSSMVYGDFAMCPIPEDAHVSPREIYGGMKLAGEVMVGVYGQRFEIPYTIVRPSAVYGPTDNNRRVLQVFVEQAVQGLGVTAHNAESTVLDFTYVTDLARGLAAALTSPAALGETFNLTRGDGRTLAEAIGILRRRFPMLQVDEVAGDDFRPRRGALDIAKAKQVLGYEPTYSLEDGIDEYIDFVLRHNPSLSPA